MRDVAALSSSDWRSALSTCLLASVVSSSIVCMSWMFRSHICWNELKIDFYMSFSNSFWASRWVRSAGAIVCGNGYMVVPRKVLG